ncbi:Glycine betaine transporter OpuD [Lachnospiraceae bacterium TWA4]|nr:Glycine betaine transporter OpuD [Lachnospiraceae bacterium TWA4]
MTKQTNKNGHARDKKNQRVFIVSWIISLIIVVIGVVNSEGFGYGANLALTFIQEHFSWFYLLAMFLFVLFCLCIAFSRYGNIKLGKEDDKPEYRTVTWFAMLFCAGMGVGLVFWGIAEPLSHYVSPTAGIESMSPEAASFSIRSCFMHWGVHPWAAYAVIGLGLAYSKFRKDRPGLLSSLFVPILGEKRTKGWIGNIIDIFAVIVTIAGIAASLGMGCLQISSGLHHLFGTPNNSSFWLIIIVVVCVIYLASSIGGLDKGMKTLSNFNLGMSGLLILLAFCVGPSIKILGIFTEGMGDYISHFITDSLSLNTFGDGSWISNWRIFYWAWWIAWAPFVGIFIARISKGRTIKEFIIGVIIVPSIASIVWFSVFGGVALNVADQFSIEQLVQLVAYPETALFIIFDHYPIGKIISIIALIVLAIFFVTSADAATFVLSMLTSEGNEHPPVYKKIIWGILQAAIAYVLILSGGVKALQTASIAASLPFIFIMIIACIGIIKDLTKEKD